MVVRPERHPATRRHPLEVSGGRPATPSVGAPAVPVEPGIGVRERGVRVGDLRHAGLEGLGPGEVDLVQGSRRLGEMEMRVGQPGDRDLVGRQRDPPGERIGAGLELDLGASEGDPPIPDADRLDPAETGPSGKRRDAPGDQECRAASPTRDRPGRRVRRPSSSSLSVAAAVVLAVSGCGLAVGRGGLVLAVRCGHRRLVLVPCGTVRAERRRDRVDRLRVGGGVRLRGLQRTAQNDGRDAGHEHDDRHRHEDERRPTCWPATRSMRSEIGPTMMIGRKLATDTSMLRIPNTRPRTSSGRSSWSWVCEGSRPMHRRCRRRAR